MIELGPTGLNPRGWVRIEKAMPITQRQENERILAYQFASSGAVKLGMTVVFVVSLIGGILLWGASVIAGIIGTVAEAAMFIALILATTSHALTLFSKSTGEITAIRLAAWRKSVRQLKIQDVGSVGISFVNAAKPSRMAQYRVVARPRPGVESGSVVAVVCYSAEAAEIEAKRIASFCGVPFDSVQVSGIS